MTIIDKFIDPIPEDGQKDPFAYHFHEGLELEEARATIRRYYPNARKFDVNHSQFFPQIENVRPFTVVEVWSYVDQEDGSGLMAIVEYTE
jgi:hypothetical protein